MAPTGKKGRKKNPETQHLTLIQKILLGALLGMGFLAMLIYVAQSIEMKNIAYAIRDAMLVKQGLLERKQELHLSLLESQSPGNIQTALERMDLNLRPGPRLEVILEREDGFEGELALAMSPERHGRWREWLGRLNRARNLMTNGSLEQDGWFSSTETAENGNRRNKNDEES